MAVCVGVGCMCGCGCMCGRDCMCGLGPPPPSLPPSPISPSILPNWAPSSKPSWVARWILYGCVGLIGFCLCMGCILGMEWLPIGPQQTSPVGSHFGYRGGPWVKLGLGLWAVCRAWSGTQLVPNQQTQLSPNLDMLWICGLNWAWVSGPSTGYKVGSIGPQPPNPVDPTLDMAWIRCKMGFGFWAVYWVLDPNQKIKLGPTLILCGYVG